MIKQRGFHDTQEIDFLILFLFLCLNELNMLNILHFFCLSAWCVQFLFISITWICLYVYYNHLMIVGTVCPVLETLKCISSLLVKGPSTLATLFSHGWPRFCGGDIYSRRKPLFSSFGEHTAVCGSSVRQAVARPRHRQSVCIHNIHVALLCSGPPQKRGHLWLNKVASVPLNLIVSRLLVLMSMLEFMK